MEPFEEEPGTESDSLWLDPDELPANHRSGFITVIGRPNVGKSTLLNHLLGQKIAITNPKPQTTRDKILGIRTDAETQFIFVDTPGIHQPKNRLGKHMVRVSEEAVQSEADVVLWVVDVTTEPTAEDRHIADQLQVLHAERSLPTVLIALNKLDQWEGDEDRLLDRQVAYGNLLQWLITDPQGQDTIPVYLISAADGTGLEDLLFGLQAQLPLGPRYYPEEQVTDLSLRFIVAEIVREKALELLHQEVPYSIAVTVTEWEERPNELTYIAATLYVERQSQKGIVLGKKGSMIKEIGQAARPDIEEMVGGKVYLDLWVKVWANWRRKEDMLQRLGYTI